MKNIRQPSFELTKEIASCDVPNNINVSSYLEHVNSISLLTIDEIRERIFEGIKAEVIDIGNYRSLFS